MHHLIPILSVLPFVFALDVQPVPPSSSHDTLLPRQRSFTRVVRRTNHSSKPRPNRLDEGNIQFARRQLDGGIESLVTDLGGREDESTTSSPVVTSKGRAAASEQTAQAGATFPTTALITATRPISSSLSASSIEIPLSTSTIASSSVEPSSATTSSSASNSLPPSEQTLSSAGIISTGLLTMPGSSSSSSSSTPSSSIGSTTSTAGEDETTTQAPAIQTQEAISTAEPVTIFSTSSNRDEGGVKTIYSTAADSVPRTSSINSNSGFSLCASRISVAFAALLVSYTLLA